MEPLGLGLEPLGLESRQGWAWLPARVPQRVMRALVRVRVRVRVSLRVTGRVRFSLLLRVCRSS